MLAATGCPSVTTMRSGGMSLETIDALLDDIESLDLQSRVPFRDDPQSPLPHRMMMAGLIAAAIHGRCDPSDRAAVEAEVGKLLRTYAAVRDALDQTVPPPGG
jgi:hypothetical protein